MISTQQSLKFKSWLIMENPDEVRFPSDKEGDSISSLISNRPRTLPWRNGITFAIFDSYYLLSRKGVRVLHESIAFRIKECERAVQAALNKEITHEELSACITSPERKSGQLFLDSKGEISEKTIGLFLKTIDLINTKIKTEKESSKPAFVAYRNLSLQKTPEVILGRIWTGQGPQERAISFWNKPQDILGQKDIVLSFVSLFGDPTTYHYDVQDKVSSYEQFMQNNAQDSPEFDTSIIHAMPPSQLKTQLQNMIGMRKSRPVDIRTKQLAQTSENFKLNEMPLSSYKYSFYSDNDPEERYYPRKGLQTKGRNTPDPVVDRFSKRDKTLISHPKTSRVLEEKLKSSGFNFNILFIEIPPGETTVYYEGDVERYIKKNNIQKDNHITFAKNASTGHLLTPWMILHTLGHALVEHDVKGKQLHVGMDDSIKTVKSVFHQGIWRGIKSLETPFIFKSALNKTILNLSELRHELVAEYLWNGQIRMTPDLDKLVSGQEVILHEVNKIELAIKKMLESCIGKVIYDKTY